jgi:undecaprenyl-diphosphatase
MSTVIYGFLAVLLTTERPLSRRVVVYGASIGLLLLITAAQLYVGAQWFTLALFALLIGASWVALLALGYRRHQPDVLSARSFLLPVGVVFIGAGTLQWTGSDQAAVSPPAHLISVAPQAWRDEAYKRQPAQRQDIAGRAKQPLNLQWAAPLADIEQRLHAAGWLGVTPVTPLNSLRWLTATTPIEDLPVLPQVHAGVHQALALRLPRDPEHQYLLRLWPSGLELTDGTPIWLGNLSAQHAESFYRLWRYPVTEPEPVSVESVLGNVENTQRYHAASGVWLLSAAAAPTP